MTQSRSSSSVDPRKRGLAPLLIPSARVLILGTLPGDQSIARQQYYGHPRNQFWGMLSAVFDEPVSDAYEGRLAFLAHHQIAVWDVLASAERRGSSDSEIRNASPNNFQVVFAACPNVRRIAFNGQKAAALFSKHIEPESVLPDGLQTATLPSTSPLSFVPFETKVKAWRAALRGSS